MSGNSNLITVLPRLARHIVGLLQLQAGGPQGAKNDPFLQEMGLVDEKGITRKGRAVMRTLGLLARFLGVRLA